VREQIEAMRVPVEVVIVPIEAVECVLESLRMCIGHENGHNTTIRLKIKGRREVFMKNVKSLKNKPFRSDEATHFSLSKQIPYQSI
jgi:hypothetical protein